jgi:hypothetical protein
MLAEVYNKNKYLLSIRIFQLMLFLSGIQQYSPEIFKKKISDTITSPNSFDVIKRLQHVTER